MRSHSGKRCGPSLAAAIPVDSPYCSCKLTRKLYAPPQHGLPSDTMALITSDCAAMRLPAQHDGPNRLGLCATSRTIKEYGFKPLHRCGTPPQHGLSSNTTALITSD